MTTDIRYQAGPLWPGMTRADFVQNDELCAVGAQGVRIRYADGTDRLDATSGLWNVPLGYGNSAILSGVTSALREASYLSNYRVENSYARQAAQALLEIANPAPSVYRRVAFATSGASANDMALKVVRQYHSLRNEGQRNGIVALDGCWHGLTFGAFALTSDSLGQRMYGADRRLVLHTPPNRVEELTRLFNEYGSRIGGIFVEPVIGTGTVTLDEAFIGSILEQRRTHGTLIIADEVATGFGRTGRFFASHSWPEPPDILVASKGLTNGSMAGAAVLMGSRVATVFEETGATLAHGETQAGTPVTCAAIMATIGEFGRLDAIARAQQLGELLESELRDLVDDEPLALGLTGVGCMRSIQLRNSGGESLEAREVESLTSHIRSAGVNVHGAPSAISILPALVYGTADVKELMIAVRSGMASYRKSRVEGNERR